MQEHALGVVTFKKKLLFLGVGTLTVVSWDLAYTFNADHNKTQMSSKMSFQEH